MCTGLDRKLLSIRVNPGADIAKSNMTLIMKKGKPKYEYPSVTTYVILSGIEDQVSATSDQRPVAVCIVDIHRFP